MTPVKDSTAYDFSLFESKQEREERAREEAPKLVTTAPKATVNTASVIRCIAVSLFIILSLVAMMFCNVQLNKLNDEEKLKGQTSLKNTMLQRA